MTEPPNVCLTLSSRAENVVLVRQALNGLAELIELDAVELNDVSTAVSEACNNVVVHAYRGAEGPLEVEIWARSDGLEVVVRDQGSGIHLSEPREQTVGGIGLPVIRALTREVDFNDRPSGGTEVRMRFDVARPLMLDLERSPNAEPPIFGTGTGSGETLRFSVGPPELAHTIMPRVLCALAAQARFSTDRISDTQLLADAILARAEDSIGASRLEVEVHCGERELRLRIGPLREGHAMAVLQAASVDGLGSVLERLADSHEIANAQAGEVLSLRLTDPSDGKPR